MFFPSQPSYCQYFLHNEQLVRVQLKHFMLILSQQMVKLQIPLSFSVSFTTQSDQHGNLTSLTIYSKQAIQLKHSNPTVLEQWQALLHQIIHKVGFHEDYIIAKNIGEGASAHVFIAKSKKDNKKVVAKAYSKNKMEAKDFFALQNQCNILKLITCPYFPQFIGTYQTQNSYYLIMQYAQGVTLKDFAFEKRDWSENNRVLMQIGQAIKKLHQLQIVHRDIKPQNIIYNVRTGQVKIVDFGFAFNLKHQKPIFSNCGTVGYAPPQSLSKIYKPSLKGDIFSLGVLAHFLFAGSLPYRPNGRSILMDTRDCNFSFSSTIKKCPSLYRLLRLMICHQSQRINIEQFLCNSFLSQWEESPKNNPQARQLHKNTDNLSNINKRIQSFYSRQRGVSMRSRQKSKIEQNYLYGHPRLITNLY